jgi:hypothetical protein
LQYDSKAKAASDTGIQPPLPIDTSAYEAVEVKARSADGTMIPLSIIRAKNLKLDGTHPTHLIGYGAYGISYDAYFDPVWLAWLERGGVIAFAHVRGGGEYGEEWYRAGYKLTKQHTIDDFIASAQYLIENKYTSPRASPAKAPAPAASSSVAPSPSGPTFSPEPSSASAAPTPLRMEFDSQRSAQHRRVRHRHRLPTASKASMPWTPIST